MNCWEYKNCDREQGGKLVNNLGICPAAEETRVNGVNSGKNGGRCCWAVAGTLCGGKVQGTAALKLTNCMTCDFYLLVRREEQEKGTYLLPLDILKLLR